MKYIDSIEDKNAAQRIKKRIKNTWGKKKKKKNTWG